MKYSKRQETTYESKVRNISNKLVAAIQGSDFLSEPFPTGKCEVSIKTKPPSPSHTQLIPAFTQGKQ